MGLELREGVEIAKIVERCGADAIDVSCGTYETLNHLMEPTTYPLGWRTYLAKAVREAVSIPVISVGMRTFLPGVRDLTAPTTFVIAP